MTGWFKRDTGTHDLGRDTRLAEALKALDPASHDPNFWVRFHSRIMAGANRELARRRLVVDLTIGDVLVSWARTVVPTALAAAAVAFLMLTRPVPAAVQQPADVEDLLLSDVPAESVPAILSASDGTVVFAGSTSDSNF